MLAQARAPNTQAILDAELRAVQRALYEAAVEIQELIVSPIERRAGMRTAVEVDVNPLLMANREHAACVAVG